MSLCVGDVLFSRVFAQARTLERELGRYAFIAQVELQYGLDARRVERRRVYRRRRRRSRAPPCMLRRLGATFLLLQPLHECRRHEDYDDEECKDSRKHHVEEERAVALRAEEALDCCRRAREGEAWVKVRFMVRRACVLSLRGRKRRERGEQRQQTYGSSLK